MNFDNGYVLSLDQAAVATYDAALAGPVLGNGKVVLMPKVKEIDTMHSMIGGDFPIRNGKYASNLTPGFHANCVQFFGMYASPAPVPPDVSLEPTSASLNMLTGIYSSSFRLTRASTAQHLADVECDLFALRPYPYCTMHSFRVTMQPGCEGVDPSFFHQVYASPSHMAHPAFAAELVHSDAVRSDPGVIVVSATGTTYDASSTPAATAAGRTIASASVYILEGPGDDFKVLGTNHFKYDPYRCYTKVHMNYDPSAASAKTFTFHVLTAQMTDADFPSPADETKRIVMNMLNKGPSPALVASRVRADHVRAWATTWNSNVFVDPKAGISPAEGDRIQKHVRAIRYSLYSLYSCTREGVNTDVNPMNLSIADMDGSSLTDGDLWIVPVLLLIKTDVARAMIEYKHKTLAVATQLAASYGQRGAKFPYHTDVLGYQSALYWDTVSPMYAFNTCIVAINAWNYYRITRDREWMFAKGYAIIKQCADYIVSLVELKDPTNPDPLLAKQWTFRHVAALSGVQGDDNALTVYTARVALRCALEASYDFQYPARDTWTDVFQNLRVPFFQDALFDVLKLHADFPADSTPASPRPPILEVLLVLLPYYNATLFGSDTRITSSTVYKNLDFYKRLVPAEYLGHPINMLLEASMLAQLAQTDQVYIDRFYDKVDAFLASCTDNVWGNFVSFGRAFPPAGAAAPLTTAPPASNDLVLVSVFLLMIVQSLGGLRIAGGVTETRFLYEEMRIKTTRSGVLPPTWRQMRLEGLGYNAKTSAIVTNQMFYPTLQ